MAKGWCAVASRGLQSLVVSSIVSSVVSAAGIFLLSVTGADSCCALCTPPVANFAKCRQQILVTSPAVGKLSGPPVELWGLKNLPLHKQFHPHCDIGMLLSLFADLLGRVFGVLLQMVITTMVQIAFLYAVLDIVRKVVNQRLSININEENEDLRMMLDNPPLFVCGGTPYYPCGHCPVCTNQDQSHDGPPAYEEN
ncbi:hypothetical protein H4582DRAFT_2060059 [Lactarius indigo]|nr:hypothetical protein H4582DRAFT_2060059 [Lactarius indigo]